MGSETLIVGLAVMSIVAALGALYFHRSAVRMLDGSLEHLGKAQATFDEAKGCLDRAKELSERESYASSRFMETLTQIIVDLQVEIRTGVLIREELGVLHTDTMDNFRHLSEEILESVHVADNPHIAIDVNGAIAFLVECHSRVKRAKAREVLS